MALEILGSRVLAPRECGAASPPPPPMQELECVLRDQGRGKGRANILERKTAIWPRLTGSLGQ